MNPFEYQKNHYTDTLFLKSDNPRSQLYSVEFDSVFQSKYVNNGQIIGDYYLPKKSTKSPLIVLVHGMGDQSVIPCKILAQSLVKRGLACFVLYLTIHSKRLPESFQGRLSHLTPDEWFSIYQNSVIDVRQVIDWANGKPEIEEKNLTVFGISFGGFISAITMGIERRINKGIFIVTGGNFEKMAWFSSARHYRKRHNRTEAEYLEIQKSYHRYLEEVSEKGLESVTPPRRNFLIDPMTYGRFLKGRPLLMINAKKDKYIPNESVVDFWEECGKPKIKWIPSGHASIWLWYPSIRNHIIQFLKPDY